MSELGQKATSTGAKTMSALAQITDINPDVGYVRFVPKAEVYDPSRL
jgi:hypothetical protein